MEEVDFQFICAGCLFTRGVLDGPELPAACPSCGLRDPWTGPIARTRFNRERAEALVDSPFYLAAQRPGS